MAQPIHLNQNLPDLGGPFLYRDQDDGEKSSYSVETPYGFLLDLDFLKYVDDIESGQTLKKVPLHRKAKGPKQSSSLRSPSSHASVWTSTESLASTASEDGKNVLLLSPCLRMQAGASETREPLSKQASNPMSPTPVINLLPPPAPKAFMRNPRVEKTLQETSRRLELEQLCLLTSEDAQMPGPPSSPSKPGISGTTCFAVPLNGNGESQAMSGLSHTGSKRMSPLNSGRSTPATNISPAHLQHVREQMAAALRQLKELEEQVKTIPVLEMKICQLKREKEKLMAGLQEQPLPESSDASVFGFPSQTLGARVTRASQEASMALEKELESVKARASKITELRRLTEKLSASERNMRASRSVARAVERECKSVGVGEEMNMNEAVFYYRSQKPCQEIGVGQETETTDAAVWVMESLLGLPTEAEKEMEMLQHTIGHQKEVIAMMEGHLKDATKELEELRVEDSRQGVREMPPEKDSCAPLIPGAGALKSIMKKRDGIPRLEAEGGRKSLQFVGVLNGEYESTSSEEDGGDSSSEKISLTSSDSDMEGNVNASDEEIGAGTGEAASSLENIKLGTAHRAESAPAPESTEVKEKFELSPRMRDACMIVKHQLSHPTAVKSKEVLSSSGVLLQEWFRVSSQKSSDPVTVASHLLAFAEVSPGLLAHVVNLADGNGNTALHYSVSHSNFQIVRLLLDTGVCNVDHQNKAGYTALMLAALASVEHDDDMHVVRRLFGMGNVNAKASQAGQTALMLAVSHGRQEMVEAVLACGADVNLQDEEGSTALMCACEHGRVETVRLLLAQPACDISIVDNDGNNAVGIALEAGHSNIAVLIYAHLNSKAQSPGTPPTASKSSGSLMKKN
uniref:KN motif and ankyrin repeat domains 3 n=1 Tax=Pelodiscus sinensis TaxID=13735 RepID=K7F4D0_PELSI